MKEVEIQHRAIKVKFSWPGIHRWLEAPESTSFLRLEHRHLFTARAVLEVHHEDRELEFFQVRNAIEFVVAERRLDGPHTFSCEQMAEIILWNLVDKFGMRSVAVEVSEDEENSGMVTWDP